MSLSLGLTQSAYAQTSRPPVAVEMQGCENLDAVTIRRTLLAEVGGRGVRESAPDPNLTEVALVCRGDEVRLRVTDPTTGKTVTRVVDVREVPGSARSRLVALAGAELVFSSWAELTAPRDPVLPIPAATASDDVRAAAEDRSREERGEASRVRVLALVGGGALSSGPTPGFGGGLRLEIDVADFLLLAAGVDGFVGEASTVAGRVQNVTVSAFLGLGIGGDTGGGRLVGLVGSRWGAAHLSSADQAPGFVADETVFGAWGGLAVSATYLYPVFGAAFIGASVEAGVVIAFPDGGIEEDPVYAADGVWVVGSLALGLAL
ncbi:MAG: hypothetical protein AAGF12_21425 [Myxococcota bacterium]